MRIREVVVAVCLLFFSGPIMAQLDNPFFKDVKSGKMESKIYGQLDYTGFFRNNEYFTNINQGQTYLGYHLMPRVHFVPNDKIKISAGFFTSKNFGELDFAEIRPVFSLETYAKNWTFIFGSTKGSLNHNLIEPMMDYEGYFYDRIEDGFQILYEDSALALDVWMDWEQATFRNSPDQEKFIVGNKLDWKFLNRKKVNLSIPLSTTFYHRGGSINDTDEKVSTRFNSSIGLSARIRSANKEIIFDNHLLYANDFSPTLSHTYQDGYGLYSNIGLKVNSLTFLASYWYGEEYTSSKGGALFNSVGKESRYYTERIRELVLLRMIYYKEIAPGLQADLRLEPYYDLKGSELEYSFSAYLRYNLFLDKKGIK
jgi:hypothetical protein